MSGYCYVMTWKFFNASNVMIKESNVTIFPLQSTNIENRVQILETEYQYEQYCIVLLSANQIADIFSC